MPLTPLKLYPPQPDRVYFYGTCLIDIFYPGASLDGIRLLRIRCGQSAYTRALDTDSSMTTNK